MTLILIAAFREILLFGTRVCVGDLFQQGGTEVVRFQGINLKI